MNFPENFGGDPHGILRGAINDHTIVAITDAEGIIVDVNEKFCRISGYSRDELLGENHRILKSGQHDREFYRNLWKTISSKQIWKGTICNKRKDGEFYWVDSAIFPLLAIDGSICGYLSLRTDVSDLKRSEEEKARLFSDLRRSVDDANIAQNQLLTLFNFAPIGISWRQVDELGNPTTNHINPRFTEIIGLTAEEALNIENVRRITHPDDWAQQDKLTSALYAGEMDRFNIEKRYIHKDGRIVWGDLTVTLLRNEAGIVTHHFAMLEDVTSRHEAEESLRRSEARWRTYLETASEILYALTPELNFKFVSPAWSQKLGHPVDQVVGRPFFDFIHRNDVHRCQAFIEDVLAERPHPDYVEYRAQHQDGSWSWHATTGSSYSDRDGRRAFFGVARDISLRKEAEDSLKASLERREELEQIINRSPAVVVLWRSDGEAWPVEFVSTSIEQFGYSAEQFTSRELAFIDITHPDDRERVQAEIAAHALGEHTEYNQEYRIVGADGSVHHVEDHTIARKDEKGRVSHHEGMITDVTERKAAEARDKEATARELGVARDVQLHLLPSNFPELPGIEIEALAQPSLALGGDYFDVLEIDKTHLGFVIADVSGKGAPAALMMAACRASLRLLAKDELSPKAAMRRLNQSLEADMPPQMFITLFYGILNLKTNELRYVRCGHEPPMILRQGDISPELLKAGGFALGLTDSELFDETVEEGSVRLSEGDLLVLYTDGINEASNTQGEEFGLDRMVDLFVRYEGQPLGAMVKRLDRHLRQFSALSQTLDDRTLLLLRLGK